MPSQTDFATRLAALALGAVIALPAADALAGDGGASVGGVRTASAAGTTLTAKRTALVLRRHAFSGRVRHRFVRSAVLVQRRAGSRWTTVARATATRDGGFRASYTPRAGGHFIYRALPASARAASAPKVGVTVFPRARAT